VEGPLFVPTSNPKHFASYQFSDYKMLYSHTFINDMEFFLRKSISFNEEIDMYVLVVSIYRFNAHIVRQTNLGMQHGSKLVVGWLK
jgi:hypothetical protein